MAIDEERLSETFAALANSTRRAILARLAEGEATVNQLAEPFDRTLPVISKHIKVLERAGLVLRGQRAQYRPCAPTPHHSSRSRPGPSSTGPSGRPVSTGWTTTSHNSKPQRKTGEHDD